MWLLAGGMFATADCRLQHHCNTFLSVCLSVCQETQEPGLCPAQLQQTRGREGWDWGRTLAGLVGL